MLRGRTAVLVFAGGAAVAVAVHRLALRRLSNRAKLMGMVKCVPYSVLGTQLSRQGAVTQAGPKPSRQTVIVDPAGLPYVSGKMPPSAAGAASGSIYTLIGLSEAPFFPAAVSSAITKPGDAKLHDYGAAVVIHVVGEDFRGGQGQADIDALRKLAAAYSNVLKEVQFADGERLVLRLLPISGGVFSAHYANDMHHLTFAALDLAFAGLNATSRRAVEKLEAIEMCIFLEKELELYQRALSWKTGVE
ncbi:hypothetical protein M885DRAFT_526184 [Pelagophyceae sp. CCMP2097]|nr:hypothetical protein M885DRAFT_526184 [Pelagophyceae sp. CCMP2097]